jgi:C4-dicarboxylate-specific signal transduction histidine kinase
VAAVAAASSILLLAAGIPLSAAGRLSTPVLVLLVVVGALVSVLLGALLLRRTVAAPVDRLLDAAEGMRDAPGAVPGLPILGESHDRDLSRAAVTFERIARALLEERERLAAKVDELTAANRSLAEARESLLRSERLATVGRLAAGLAHEVGNPLGAITGYVELGRSRLPKEIDAEVAGAFGRIAAAAERIDRTVRGLLDFARPAAPTLTPVDVSQVVEGVLRLLRGHARFRGVDVGVAIPATLPPVVADPHQLEQVLVNLLLNAADAMAGLGRVEVHAALAQDGTGPRVLLTVRDRGPGIPPEILERIFDPFFTTKEPGSGSGLGLAISSRIVESFGGDLRARNGAAGGAELTISLRIGPPVTPSGA